MKRLLLVIMMVCLFAGCSKIEEKGIKANAPVMGQKFIARFTDRISLYREFDDRLLLQKEHTGQVAGFDVYSLDITAARLIHEYSYIPKEMLLYSIQLDKDTKLEVRQLGNGEENNIMVLEGNASTTIAKNIAYSGAALVSISPNKQYILYCTPDVILNRYSLWLYDRKSAKTRLLVEPVQEELLNDMEGNISWSPDLAFIVVSNKLLIDVRSGKQLSEFSADNLIWSDSSKRLAYIKNEKGWGRTISVIDIASGVQEEVFISNQDEYLSGYMVWSQNEAKLAFAISIKKTQQQEPGLSAYSAIYSLDLEKKEAVRVDTALNMGQAVVAKLESMQYNNTGNVLALAILNSQNTDLYIYNFNQETSSFINNLEYLHSEDNEAYTIDSGGCLYFIQGQEVFELNEKLYKRSIYKSEYNIEDIYISSDGTSMVVIEASEKGIILRQLTNFIRRGI